VQVYVFVFVHFSRAKFTGDSRQQTADSRQQTSDSRPQTADIRHQTADSVCAFLPNAIQLSSAKFTAYA
jgi:hypothetical protein